MQGGGIQSRTDPMIYDAPANGYLPMIEVFMFKNDQHWMCDFTTDYFLKLGNGTYARITVNPSITSDQVVEITSYLNPQPGHTNLEYDPTQQVKAP